jgi:hypothetical protein
VGANDDRKFHIKSEIGKAEMENMRPETGDGNSISGFSISAF